MAKRLAKQIEKIISNGEYDQNTVNQFLQRLPQDQLTRDENPYTHFCVYFAAFDPRTKKIFLGHHKKSGLWLFNGGHIDKDETLEQAITREINEEWGIKLSLDLITKPQLLTVTEINNPTKQTCTKHFDIWYFVPVSEHKFLPRQEKLNKEFHITGWKDAKQARALTTDPSTLIAIHKFEMMFMQT